MGRVLPILFNTEMVRAILDGRKTVTRRLVKLPKYIQEQENGLYTLFAEGTCYENQNFEQIIDYLKKPYQPGDILYVRETWFYEHHMEDVTAGEPDLPSGRYSYRYVYKADNSNYPVNIGVEATGWHPSIHMPKEAARIWLKCIGVRVERLQEIDGQEVLKEGLNSHVHPKADYFDMNQKEMFEKLWNTTLKKSDLDRYGWNANPWVWVIEFERCEKPEGEV